MNPIVTAVNLSRFYGVILGLNNVSFTIGPGITGVVGPNGAGKTTLFRLLTGQIQPSSGSLRVFGASPWKNPEVRAKLGYCPENEVVPESTDAVAWLVALGMISGLSARDARTRAVASLERVKLPAMHWKKNLTALSKGMKQRVKLAQCLLHEPQLVILDEPMNGLDPMGREDMANVLRELAAGGASVVISSHILHDLEALCGEFLMLRWGRLPRANNAAASVEARRRWPESTTFWCTEPADLARFFFAKDLVRGCDVVAETGLVHVRWRDPELFYGRFHELLLECGISIYEVRATTSVLEKVVTSAANP
jgi:ABC-2 type transport system ATP-binding protein